MLDWLLETLFPAGHDVRVVSEGPPWVDPQSSDEFGLVGVGGDLEPGVLLSAYRQGVFPVYEEGEPVCWGSPDPRAVFGLDGLHVSPRLERPIRSGPFERTSNHELLGRR